MSVRYPLSGGTGYRLSGPVSRVLFHAGQAVEHRAFSHVRVSGENGHCFFVIGHCLSFLRLLRLSFRSRRGGRLLPCPLRKKPSGSPRGLFPMHLTTLPGVNPRSRSLLLISPVLCSSVTLPDCPGFSSDIFLFMFCFLTFRFPNVLLLSASISLCRAACRVTPAAKSGY